MYVDGIITHELVANHRGGGVVNSTVAYEASPSIR